MVYTIVGDDFRQWVSNVIRDRNSKVASKNDLIIELDPEIAKAFKSSLNISSKSINQFLRFFHFLTFLCIFFIATKGRGVHILKPGSKRRRT